MKDIDCPYCGEEFDDPDYWELAQDEPYELECPKCEKMMMVTFELIPFFRATKCEPEKP